MDYRDIAERTLWTFAQAFLGAAVIGGEISVKAGMVAGLAAVASLLKNAIKTSK